MNDTAQVATTKDDTGRVSDTPLTADQLIRNYVNSLLHNKPDDAAKATRDMVEYVFAQREADLNKLIDNAFMCQRGAK